MSDIRVLLVDDQELVRMGLAMVLDSEDGLAVVGQCADGQEAVDWVGANAGAADVILMDVRMPRLDGVGATEQIVATDAAPKVLVLTTFDLDEHVYAALGAGASGFLLKDAGPHELLAGIRAVHRGDAVVAPSATRRLIDRMAPGMAAPQADSSRLEALTDREREVLELIAQGDSNQEIAATLFLAEATVKTHIGRILAKLGLRDRVHLVVFAYETGLVRPGR